MDTMGGFSILDCALKSHGALLTQHVANLPRCASVKEHIKAVGKALCFLDAARRSSPSICSDASKLPSMSKIFFAVQSCLLPGARQTAGSALPLCLGIKHPQKDSGCQYLAGIAGFKGIVLHHTKTMQTRLLQTDCPTLLVRSQDPIEPAVDSGATLTAIVASRPRSERCRSCG